MEESVSAKLVVYRKCQIVRDLDRVENLYLWLISFVELHFNTQLAPYFPESNFVIRLKKAIQADCKEFTFVLLCKIRDSAFQKLVGISLSSSSQVSMKSYSGLSGASSPNYQHRVTFTCCDSLLK